MGVLKLVKGITFEDNSENKKMCPVCNESLYESELLSTREWRL